jgi:hypothetical protein
MLYQQPNEIVLLIESFLVVDNYNITIDKNIIFIYSILNIENDQIDYLKYLYSNQILTNKKEYTLSLQINSDIPNFYINYILSKLYMFKKIILEYI